MATELQKLAMAKMAEKVGRGEKPSVSAVMREVGYANVTAATPKKLTESNAWKELYEKELPDNLLARVHKEGLKATKKQFKNNNQTGEIEEVAVEADYSVRHKYLDSAYKLKNRFPKEKDTNINVGIFSITQILNKAKEDD